MIEIEGPDGVIYEFPEGTDENTMRTAMQGVYGAPQPASPMDAGLAELSALSQPEMIPPSVADYAGQAGAGSQEGIASILGFPVDAVTGGINGVGALTGLWSPIENPVGGSASIGAALEPFRSDIPQPRTAGEAFARRVGEEVGAGAAGFPLALSSNAGRGLISMGDEAARLVGRNVAARPDVSGSSISPIAAALVDGASSLGSGVGAATANYLSPDSVTAEVIGSLLGGVPVGMLASRAAGLDGQAAQVAEGTMESQKRRAADAYRTVADDTSIIGPQGATDLELGIIQRAIDSGIDPDLTPNAAALEKGISRRIGPNMTIEDVEDLRRIVGGGISNTASDSDKRVAMAMKNEITDYLDSLNTPATEALREGRDATRRYKAAELVTGATEKAERRAAASGSGGNEINAIRQNLRGILDNPNKARSFTTSERAAMEEIVRGSTDQNMMRRLSRFAPSSGGLASMLGIGGALANPAVTMPIVGVTEGAKMMGERSTQKSVDNLVRSLLGERVTKVGETGIDPIVAALLGLRISAQGDE